MLSGNPGFELVGQPLDGGDLRAVEHAAVSARVWRVESNFEAIKTAFVLRMAEAVSAARPSTRYRRVGDGLVDLTSVKIVPVEDAADRQEPADGHPEAPVTA